MFCGKASILLVVIIGTVWFSGAPAEASPNYAAGTSPAPDCPSGWSIRTKSFNLRNNGWTVICEEEPTIECGKIALGFGWLYDGCKTTQDTRTITTFIQSLDGNSDWSAFTPRNDARSGQHHSWYGGK